jgi:hypothetical protein
MTGRVGSQAEMEHNLGKAIVNPSISILPFQPFPILPALPVFPDFPVFPR